MDRGFVFVSTSYELADPKGGTVSVDLSQAGGKHYLEWFHPETGQTKVADTA